MDLYLRCLIDVLVEVIGEVDSWSQVQHEAFRQMYRGIITMEEFCAIFCVDFFYVDAEALRWRRNLRIELTKDYPLFYTLLDGKVVCLEGA